MRRRGPGGLPRWQQWSVYVGFGMLLATGIAWLLLDNFVQVKGEFGPEHHPAEHVALIVHGVFAYGFLIIAGAMLPVHIPLGWNVKRNHKSGTVLVATLLLLAVSALGLYYAGDDVLRSRLSLVHWGLGLLAAPLMLFHALPARTRAHKRGGNEPRTLRKRA